MHAEAFSQLEPIDKKSLHGEHETNNDWNVTNAFIELKNGHRFDDPECGNALTAMCENELQPSDIEASLNECALCDGNNLFNEDAPKNAAIACATNQEQCATNTKHFCLTFLKLTMKIKNHKITQ